MISSFHTSCLEVAKDLRPDWPRAYISFEVSEHWHADLTRLDCASFHLWHRLTDAELVREIKDMGLGMACFTVNETALGRIATAEASGQSRLLKNSCQDMDALKPRSFR